MKNRYITSLFVSILCLFLISACSSKNGPLMQLFCDKYADAYQSAAKKYYSNVEYTQFDYSENDKEVKKSIGSDIKEDTRYAVVVTDDPGILDEQQLDGKLYSIYICDEGKGDITVAMYYCVGTTENCVAQGNVSSGEIAFTRTIYVQAASLSDPAQRAAAAFEAIHQAILNIEGE